MQCLNIKEAIGAKYKVVSMQIDSFCTAMQFTKLKIHTRGDVCMHK